MSATPRLTAAERCELLLSDLRFLSRMDELTIEDFAPVHSAVARIATTLRLRDPDFVARRKAGLAASRH